MSQILRQMPLGAGPATRRFHTVCQASTKLIAPGSDCFVVDHIPALEQQFFKFFDITQAELKPEIPAYRATDDRCRKAIAESVHQLQREIYTGKVAPERGRRRDEMIAISGSLTLLTNVVIAWNTQRMQATLDAWQRKGQGIDDDWFADNRRRPAGSGTAVRKVLCLPAKPT